MVKVASLSIFRFTLVIWCGAPSASTYHYCYVVLVVLVTCFFLFPLFIQISGVSMHLKI